MWLFSADAFNISNCRDLSSLKVSLCDFKRNMANSWGPGIWAERRRKEVSSPRNRCALNEGNFHSWTYGPGLCRGSRETRAASSRSLATSQFMITRSGGRPAYHDAHAAVLSISRRPTSSGRFVESGCSRRGSAVVSRDKYDAGMPAVSRAMRTAAW